MWLGINEIIYSKKAHKTNSSSSLLGDNETITNIPQMPEHFNQYFTSIGKNLQKCIPPTKRHFPDYSKDPNQNRFFIDHTTAEEVKDIILTLKQEFFLTYAKWRKLFLSSEVKQGYFAIIIDQFPCLQILVKSLKN